jgi:hypothetical protein
LLQKLGEKARSIIAYFERSGVFLAHVAAVAAVLCWGVQSAEKGLYFRYGGVNFRMTESSTKMPVTRVCPHPSSSIG